VEKFIPPRKGRSTCCGLFAKFYFRTKRRGTDLTGVGFFLRVTAHKAIAVVISDFIGSQPRPRGKSKRRLRPQWMLLERSRKPRSRCFGRLTAGMTLSLSRSTDPRELELPRSGGSC